MNWNAIPRSEVEKAAAAGDVDAQSCLRLHERLDGIDAAFEQCVESVQRLRETVRECIKTNEH